MHDIEALMRIIGLSENQIRVRLREFRPYLDIRHGKNNKLLVTDSGLKILERVKELEQQGLTLDDIKTRLDEELNLDGNRQEDSTSGQVQPDTTQNEPIYNQYITDLRSNISLLQKQLEEKDRMIRELYGIIKDRLPALPAPAGDNHGRKARRWYRFKQFLKGE